MTTPNETTPQQLPGTVSFWAQLRQYFVSNVMATLWSVSLFWGGLIFLVYFYSIDFLPEFDLQTSLTLLASAALTGGFILLVLGVYLLAPALVWRGVVINDEKLKFLWYNEEEFLQRRAALWFVIPNILILAIFSVGVCMGIAFSIIIIISIISCIILWPNLLNNLDINLRGYIAVFFLILCFLSAIYFVFPLIVLYGLLQEAHPSFGILIRISLVVVTLLVNTIMAVSQVRSWYLYCFIPFLFLFTIFTWTNKWNFIPKTVMRTYKLGNIANASVVLNDLGCMIAKHHELKGIKELSDLPTFKSSVNPNPSPNPNPKTCALPDVMIHSRVGTLYYLEATRSDDTSVRFTVPGQHVLSWMVKESKQGKPGETPSSNQSPAPVPDATRSN